MGYLLKVKVYLFWYIPLSGYLVISPSYLPAVLKIHHLSPASKLNIINNSVNYHNKEESGIINAC